MKGVVSGATVLRISAVNMRDDGPGAGQRPEVGGGFGFSLPPGDYYLEFKLADRTVRLGQPLTIRSGVVREVKIHLEENPPRATFSEELTLAEPSPPAPSPTGSPTPMPSKSPAG